MELLDVQNRINSLMAQFYAEVRGAVTMGRTDLLKTSETVLIPLLSEVYGYTHLKNLNALHSNFPAIDLGDDLARVAFQVTATADIEKIKDTLSRFTDHKLYERFNRLVFYILTEKQRSYSDSTLQSIVAGRFKFDPHADIIDYRDILNEVKDMQVSKVLAIQKILDDNLGRIHRAEVEEVIDRRKEHVYLNLIPISFPKELYLAPVQDDIYSRIKNKKDKRRSLQEILYDDFGERFAVDWEVYEAKILTFHDLTDETLPLSRLIDLGGVEVFDPEDIYSINENYERVFKALLRRCLQQKLYQRNVKWQKDEHLFIFVGNDDKSLQRKEHWRGKVDDDRVVFEKTMKNNKPDEILKCKHFAFSVELEYIDNQWFLMAKPDWFFSFNGYNKSFYSEDDLDWLKRHENNNNLFNHLRFINYFLSDNITYSVDLFGNRKSYPFLSFGKVISFDNASCLNDREWNPKKADKNQLRLMPDQF